MNEIVKSKIRFVKRLKTGNPVYEQTQSDRLYTGSTGENGKIIAYEAIEILQLQELINDKWTDVPVVDDE